MSASADSWLILPERSRLDPLQALPAAAPLAARVMHAAYARFVPAVRAEIRGGRFGSRSVTRAFDQLCALSPDAVKLTRSERQRGGAYLVKLHAQQGGIL
ncbi:hypothetical protein ACF044_05830 [Microbacterium sp. NPDC016588]